MAPSKSTVSTRGKTRMYMCRSCGLRHASPTGVNCPHVSPSRTVKRKLPTKLPVTQSKATARPAVDVTDERSRDAPGRTYGAGRARRPLLDTSSDDESSPAECLTPSTLTPSEEVEQMPFANPPETSRPPESTSRGSSRRARSPREGDMGHTEAILDQMRRMQEQNHREMLRMEHERLSDRRAIEQAIMSVAASVQANPNVSGTMATPPNFMGIPNVSIPPPGFGRLPPPPPFQRGVDGLTPPKCAIRTAPSSDTYRGIYARTCSSVGTVPKHEYRRGFADGKAERGRINCVG